LIPENNMRTLDSPNESLLFVDMAIGRLLVTVVVTIATAAFLCPPSASSRQSWLVNRDDGIIGAYSGEKMSSSNNTVGWEFAGLTTYVYKFGDEPHLAAGAAVQNIVRGGTISSSAGNDAIPHWFMSSVNGGVWRTSNLQDERPHWVNVLDGQPEGLCTSISALHYSRRSGHVYAGCGGSTSSEQGSDWNVVNSGDWGGLIVSKDNGDTWAILSSFPVNYYVTDILELTTNEQHSVLLVSAQSHLYNKTEGGIWQSKDSGTSFRKVHHVPTFGLTPIKQQQHGTTAVVLATHARTLTIAWSINYGASFESYDILPWKRGAEPFYTCATLLGNGRLVIGGLTRLEAGLPNHTDSQMFVTKGSVYHHHPHHHHQSRHLIRSDQPESLEWLPMSQPSRLDEDSMPKDRMALLADPELHDLLYVAGNAEALAWRVNVTTNTWTKMWDRPDVLDGSLPHADCRNYCWDSQSNRLLLVTDGGLFARERPREPGGRWISLNGDYSALELLSAHYDPHQDRYVMGAQDNCAIVTKENHTYKDMAYGFVEGDGAITLVDSSRNPSRLFGTTQFLGVGTIENDPKAKGRTSSRTGDADDDDDDDCGGLCFVEGDRFVEVPVSKYFSEPSSFPFFVHPYTLNQQDPTKLQFWTNGTLQRPSAIYEFQIPSSVKDADDISPPNLVLETPPGSMILDFVSGGYTDGQPDPTLIVAVSSTHLFVRNRLEGQDGPTTGLLQRPLPVAFADPVTLVYDDDGQRILGPLTHARTVSMAVSPSDSHWIAVTGWPSVDNNKGDESVFLTIDAGKTWHNATGNLRDASGVVGKVRPGGLLFVELDEGSSKATTRVLLVGTSNGILVSFLTAGSSHDSNATISSNCWSRLGSVKEFPVVLTSDVDYEPISDRLVAATFGRGILVLRNAKERLAPIQKSSTCNQRELTDDIAQKT